MALLDRFAWIYEHEKEHSPETAMAWMQRLQGFGCEPGMLQQALYRIDSLPLPWLLQTIQRVPISHLKILELSQRHVAANGWNLELVEAIRKWLSSSCFGTSGSANLERAKVEWFLWFEDAAPIRLEVCWSHLVKQDLRQMTAEQRAAWVKLLENASFTITAKPSKKWLKAAEAAFPKIGAADFRSCFVAWFEPFSKDEQLRLTVCGRNILRLLIWTALIAKDPAVDEALAGFAKAKWRTQENQRRAAQAEMAFSYVLAERTPEAALSMLETMVLDGRGFSGSTTGKIYEALCKRLGREPVAPVKHYENVFRRN
jgi:hypothetical protein